jgi:ATP-dependent Clp protease ATP-binding subunit ClpA
MYETFTDRARKVMRLAHQEAQILSHDYIGTEHILLGLIKEGSGVAANVLKHLGFNLLEVRLEVSRVVECDTDEARTGKLPRTPLALKVTEDAIEEARNLKHNYVGTEHLLLGLLRQQEGAAAEVLLNLGHRLGDIRQVVLTVLGHHTPPPKMQGSHMYERFTDRARKVMQLANQEAQRLNHEYIGTEHILLGLVKEGDGVAANILKNLDADLRKIRLEVEKIAQAGPDWVHPGKLPQTPHAKRVIEYSIEEARKLEHKYVGTEHLLLGLLREKEGVAAQVLVNMGLRLEDVREEVLELLGQTVDEEADVTALELPVEIQQTIRDLDAQIEQLNREKEEAVAQADFEKAALLRDRADKLKRRKEKIANRARGPLEDNK